MKSFIPFRSMLITAALALAGSGLQAQPGPGAAAGPGPGASAPGPGASPMNGPGMGGGKPRHHKQHHGGRWGERYTPGWSLMSPEERDAHRQQMQAVKSYDECIAVRDKHREQMTARAKEKGLSTPPRAPRRDACAVLKPKAAAATP